MVNVRAAANRLTSAINPNVAATWQQCTGYTTDATFKQVPDYAAPVPIVIQAQTLTKREIEHLDNLNISNVDRAVYANAQLTGVDRTKGSGGDLLTFEGAVWLVVVELEGWPSAGWSKVGLRRQMDAPQ